MKKIYAMVFLLVSHFFAAQAQFVVNGNAASLGGDVYRLTEENFGQGGSVWYQTRLNLNYNFSVQTELYFGRIDAGGADGIAFVLQPLNSGVGSAGGGIGYQGISPSLAIEFDTWQNSEFGDPAEDHLEFMKNGDLNHSSANNPGSTYTLPNIEDATWHPATFSWNATTKTMTLTFLGNTYTYTNDIVANIFGGSPYAYWGFTGATGAAYNLQQVHIISYASVDEGITAAIVNASCSNASNGAIDITVTPADTYTYSWSNGATSEDLNNLAPGTYTVSATKGSLTLTGTFTVGTQPDNTAPVPDVSPLPALTGTAPYTVNTTPTAHDNCAGLLSATTADPLIYNAPGTYTITWTYSDGTNTVSQTQTVEVTQSNGPCTPPTFLNNLQIVLDASECGNDGNISIIPLSGTAPFMYSIDGGATYVPGGNAGHTFQQLAAGTYQLRLKDANGCESAVVTREVRANVYPCNTTPCTPPTFLNNSQIVLDASCSGGDGALYIIPTSGTAPFMYSIDGGATYVSGPNSGYAFQNLSAGTYQLRLKDAGGCESAVVTKEVKANAYGPCAVQALNPRLRSGAVENAGVRAYPNPSRGQFQVQLQRFGAERVQVQILDSRGAVLQTRTVNARETSTLDINLTGKAKGLYLVRVVSDKGIQTSKITIQ